MRTLFAIAAGLFTVFMTGCDVGHGHSHDDKTPPNHHQSID